MTVAFRPALPAPLRVMEVVGLSVLALGAAKHWGEIETLPISLRFDGYGLALVLIGATMVVPAFLYTVRSALAQARAQSPLSTTGAASDLVDHGFCLSYNRLSNRRKFLRTRLFAPIAIPLGAYLLWTFVGESRIVLVPVFVLLTSIVAAVQMIAAYKAWKAEENI